MTEQERKAANEYARANGLSTIEELERKLATHYHYDKAIDEAFDKLCKVLDAMQGRKENNGKQ